MPPAPGAHGNTSELALDWKFTEGKMITHHERGFQLELLAGEAASEC
jgi:hypothetical protein